MTNKPILQLTYYYLDKTIKTEQYATYEAMSAAYWQAMANPQIFYFELDKVQK